MPCFVHDGRQAVAFQHTVVLTLPESTSPDFRLTHEKALSDTLSYDNLIAIMALPTDGTVA
jgi:hypothetical protein